MDEKTSSIEQHIDTERVELGRNLDELENRVKNATDLKAHFNKNTGLILGAAVVGGFALSLAFRGRSKELAPPRDRSAISPAQPPRRVSKHLNRLSDTVDNIFDGLVGLASDRLQSFVADAVPGFQPQYDATSRQRGAR